MNDPRIKRGKWALLLRLTEVDSTKSSTIEPEVAVNKGGSLILGMGLGLGLMYILDPDRGRTRRALVRNKTIHGMSATDHAVGVAIRDASHRLEGILSRLRVPTGPIPDDIIALRVRSRIGRCVSHPRALSIEVGAGRVILSGPVLQHELEGLLQCARSTPGVVAVENRLETHPWAEDVPALQGGQPRRGIQPDWLQERWAPTTRVLVGLCGSALLTQALVRKSVLSPLPAIAGGTLLSRSIANQPLARILGIGVGSRLIDFQKTFEIQAPVEQLWQFWTDPQDFPRVMAHIKEVRHLGDGRYHWIVMGPLGLDFDFDAQVVHQEPEHSLEWRGLPGAEIGVVGSLRLDPTPDGGTRVDIKFSYHPPLGALGHAVAWLTRTDPHHALNEDMVRVKSFFEEGKTSVRGREIRRTDLTAAATPGPAE